MKKLLTVLSLAAMVLAFGQVANALPTTITYAFTSDHCTGGCLTGQTNGGTITITQNANNTLTYDVELANGNQFINAGFDASFGFNLVGNPTITYSGVTAGWTPQSGTQSAGSLHMDGTGFFEYGLNWGGGPGGSDPGGSSLMFTISSASGLSLSSLEANALLQFFAADIISGTTGRTGGIDASTTTTPVPDGGTTAMLLGSALLGVGGLRRRFGKG